jgi:hypothetical protein
MQYRYNIFPYCFHKISRPVFNGWKIQNSLNSPVSRKSEKNVLVSKKQETFYPVDQPSIWMFDSSVQNAEWPISTDRQKARLVFDI